MRMNNLKTLWKKDQQERLTYQQYLNKYNHWKTAIKKYQQDHGPLTDYTPQAIQALQHQPITHLDHDDWTALWGLAQHADNHPTFQKHVLHLILQHKGPHWKTHALNPPAYQYLHDRIQVNNNKKQKYNTQNTSHKTNKNKW